jgi:hypothetical protein
MGAARGLYRRRALLYADAVMETSFNFQLVKSGNPPQTLGWQTQTWRSGDAALRLPAQSVTAPTEADET